MQTNVLDRLSMHGTPPMQEHFNANVGVYGYFSFTIQGNFAHAFPQGAGSIAAGLTVLYIFKHPLNLDVLLLGRLLYK